MLGEVIKIKDFKEEKHVPTIDCPDKVQPNEEFEVDVQVGKEIKHPNTVEHHIEWIDLFMQYDDDPNTVHVGRYIFGPVMGEPHVKAKIKLAKSGTLIALSHCNIHGLWENTKKVSVG
ncbi:class II SORL domain-containing protein [Petrotoga olearia]|uniref:Neelaredoxin n=2 Tax=Petrotoga olearia TaxID=156203 RepID=A0A2K1P018_9BACT|nr:class II SORL domain-containing protein [Petrotoga olearia]KUK15825.1 MAG: Desulfoferrodoxin ferrous iron-binding region [Petrotoga mobilis]PNR96124.1 Neelaredoxin [Petrotoga olearia DSM 13574]RMA71566.1 superoxide reductase [Petrotoga olearia]